MWAYCADCDEEVEAECIASDLYEDDVFACPFCGNKDLEPPEKREV